MSRLPLGAHGILILIVGLLLKPTPGEHLYVSSFRRRGSVRTFGQGCEQVRGSLTGHRPRRFVLVVKDLRLDGIGERQRYRRGFGIVAPATLLLE